MLAFLVIEGNAQMLTGIVEFSARWGEAIKDPDEGSKIAARKRKNACKQNS